MKDKNPYLLKKISLLYIILIPVYYLMEHKYYDANILFIWTSITLILLSCFNYVMSYVKNVIILNLIYGILYLFAFTGLSYILFYSDGISIELVCTVIILALSIVFPFFIYWYLKKKGIFISILIMSFNFLIVIWSLCINFILYISYGI